MSHVETHSSTYCAEGFSEGWNYMTLRLREGWDYMTLRECGR